MTTYSREFLQSYRSNLQTINIVEQILKEVIRLSSRAETCYVYPISGNKYLVADGSHVTTDKIVSMLKERLPNVTVEYQEVKNIHGKTECGIVIDWS